MPKRKRIGSAITTFMSNPLLNDLRHKHQVSLCEESFFTRAEEIDRRWDQGLICCNRSRKTITCISDEIDNSASESEKQKWKQLLVQFLNCIEHLYFGHISCNLAIDDGLPSRVLNNLLEALKGNTTVQALNFSSHYCILTDDNVMKILAMWKQKPSITMLDLGYGEFGSYITEEGVFEVMKAMKFKLDKGHQLQWVDVEGYKWFQKNEEEKAASLMQSMVVFFYSRTWEDGKSNQLSFIMRKLLTFKHSTLEARLNVALKHHCQEDIKATLKALHMKTIFRQNEPKHNAFFNAITLGNYSLVDNMLREEPALLEIEIQKNDIGNYDVFFTPLTSAIAFCQDQSLRVAMVTLLIAKGASLTHRIGEKSSPFHLGGKSSPMKVALAEDDKECISLFRPFAATQIQKIARGYLLRKGFGEQCQAAEGIPVAPTASGGAGH